MLNTFKGSEMHTWLWKGLQGNGNAAMQKYASLGLGRPAQCANTPHALQGLNLQPENTAFC
jgi:hypothetical protein